MTDAVASEAAAAALPPPPPPPPWTPATVAAAAGAFLLAGVLEIGGGWLVWTALRDRSAALPAVPAAFPRWLWVAAGVAALGAYGFVPLLQPPSPAAAFGRLYAVYGCVFIGLSVAWGAAVDGLRVDAGDWLGGGAGHCGGAARVFLAPRRGVGGGKGGGVAEKGWGGPTCLRRRPPPPSLPCCGDGGRR